MFPAGSTLLPYRGEGTEAGGRGSGKRGGDKGEIKGSLTGCLLPATCLPSSLLLLSLPPSFLSLPRTLTEPYCVLGLREGQSEEKRHKTLPLCS